MNHHALRNPNLKSCQTTSDFNFEPLSHFLSLWVIHNCIWFSSSAFDHLITSFWVRLSVSEPVLSNYVAFLSLFWAENVPSYSKQLLQKHSKTREYNKLSMSEHKRVMSEHKRVYASTFYDSLGTQKRPVDTSSIFDPMLSLILSHY